MVLSGLLLDSVTIQLLFHIKRREVQEAAAKVISMDADVAVIISELVNIFSLYY